MFHGRPKNSQCNTNTGVVCMQIRINIFLKIQSIFFLAYLLQICGSCVFYLNFRGLEGGGGCGCGCIAGIYLIFLFYMYLIFNN